MRLHPFNCWPVIQRELRAGSHVAFNYWIRVVAAAISMMVLLIGTSAFTDLPPGMQGSGIL